MEGMDLVDNQFSFYFQTWKELNQSFEKTTVHVSIDQDLEVIKVEVDLGSLPPVRLDGWEIIVDFEIEKFDNNGTFYTDSNELEMQKRILNYRPTWDIQTNYNRSNENVTANYYPINSAITMKEFNSSRCFTVMNDRPQAGSAIKDGHMQFMQNRRIPADDGRGMGEFLNEENAQGEGIEVKATYFVDIYREKEIASKQRLVQHRQDDPPQYFFNSNLTQKGKGQASTLSEDLKNAGIVDTVKYVSIPKAKNEVYLRIENLADLVDWDAKALDVDVKALLNALLKSANGALPQGIWQITPMSLTGNQSLADMRSKKIQWKTVDDTTVADKELDFDLSADKPVSLVPQRIIAYNAKFVPAEGEILFLQ